MKVTSSIFLLLVILIPIKGISQSSVKEMVDTKRFVFQAQSLTPLKGSMRTLSPGYTIKVSPDTVVCDLPYVGRAFQASYGSSDGGMKFLATKFDYTLKEKKKGWTININPKEISGSPKVIVSVFENGNARVTITSNDRESISYSGVVVNSGK